MELYFEDCDYGEDFESLCDIPEDWYGGDDMSALYNNSFIWFKAYDTSMCELSREEELYAQGYGFDCYVWLEVEYMGKREYLLDGVPARDRAEAERLLQLAADALYGEE